MLLSTLTDLLPSLQVIGLFVDILGAFVIAVPDIPYLNNRLRGGKLREARVKLQTSSLTHAMTGYAALLEELDKYDGQTTPPPEVVTVEYGGGKMNGSPIKEIFGHYSSEEKNTMDSMKLIDMPFSLMELHLHEQIKRSEGKIRSIGFGILAVGFSIQIWSLL